MKLAIAVGAIAALAGCLRHTSYQSCQTDADCSGNHCESNHACSVDDQDCPSGRRWHSSAPLAGQCVDGTSNPDAPMVVIPPGRECVQGLPLPATYSACAAKVDGKEARCGTEMWDAVCVRTAEVQCQMQCAQLAFVGTEMRAFVMRTRDDQVVWRDPLTDYEVVVGSAWADYDNDGDPDLATAGDGLLRIFKNEGYDDNAGTLVLTQVSSKSWSTISPQFPEFGGTDAQWVDYDHDGDLDAVFGGYAGLFVMRNDGGDVFLDQPPLLQTVANIDGGDPIGANVIRTAWGDADDDGYPELAVVRFGKAPLFFHNDHGGTMTQASWGNGDPDFGGGVAWCNVDKDAAPELVLSGYSYVRIADNVLGKPADQPVQLNNESGSDIECADFDGDGDLDLFVTGDDGVPSRAYTNGATTIASFSESWRDTSANAMAGKTHQWNAPIGDLDGDHKLDAWGVGNAQDAPITYQPYPNASTTNKVQFTVPAPVVLTAEQQSNRLMSFAPAIGH
ncbi:MAG TPA: VCBS repeat-containing protein [Kofleriaceae bacterium]|nr:VCBS repeat-containing protein [Kofleriaceae bacterium]